MVTSDNILDLVNTMKSGDRPFALATVVRTVAATAAKPGAKAVILADGSIEGGWVGGGCARAAVLKAAQAALQDGHPRLVSIQPMDLLKDQGLRPGDERAGIAFAKNMCPSQGTMDVFVEPFLPRPQLVVCGSSPVAVALARQAAGLGFALTIAAPGAERDAFADLGGRAIYGYDLSELAPG
jgi:xanthine dehydrogenase accessory factor